MEHCRLPIEICEHIIDTFVYDMYNPWEDKERLAALRACALTCKSWHPRSLCRLYHVLFFCGGERTKKAIQWLRERTDALAIHVRVLTNVVTFYEQPKEKLPPHSYPRPIHLVPLLLAPLHSTIIDIETINIGTEPLPQGYGDDMAVLGREIHDSFLRSYTCFRSVHTLKLWRVHFDAFAYLPRLLLSFRALRHLHLNRVSYREVNNYPQRVAKLKQLSLRTFSIVGVGDLNLLHIVRWLLQAGAFSLLESLSLVYNSPRDLASIITKVMANAGASLKHLDIDTSGWYAGRGDRRFDCRLSSSLQTIDLHKYTCSTASFILSTIPSREISVTLHETRAGGVADVDGLIELLVSDRSTSPLKFNRISVEIMPSYVWHDRLIGTAQERKQAAETEIEGSFSKLRGVFGERLYAGICWNSDWLSDRNQTADPEEIESISHFWGIFFRSSFMIP